MNEEPAGPIRKKRNRGIIIIVVLLALLIGGSLSAWYFLNNDAEAVEKELLMSSAMDFTVNLADSQQRRYLKTTIQFGYYIEDVGDEIVNKTPEIRDFVIEIIRSRKVSDIEHSKGTNELKAELIGGVNVLLASGEVMEVFFTDFLIQ